jgi:hypothetical protein
MVGGGGGAGAISGAQIAAMLAGQAPGAASTQPTQAQVVAALQGGQATPAASGPAGPGSAAQPPGVQMTPQQLYAIAQILGGQGQQPGAAAVAPTMLRPSAAVAPAATPRPSAQ